MLRDLQGWYSASISVSVIEPELKCIGSQIIVSISVKVEADEIQRIVNEVGQLLKRITVHFI